MAADGQADHCDMSTIPLVECESEEDIALDAPSARPRLRVAAAVASCAGLATLACASLTQGGAAASSALNILRLVTVVDGEGEAPEAPTCAADGGSCLESQCCQPGGMNGLQCYKKNDNWASCAPSCEPGVHEPEKEGTWDANGAFQKAQWSCEKLGKVSDPGCEGYTNSTRSKCPKDRCQLKGSECRQRCDLHGDANICWKAKDCMWQEEKGCMDACWSFGTGETCAPSDVCHWTGKQCQVGWWRMYNYDQCDQDLGYMWNESGWSCVQDPCSGIGEDCSETKCCSTTRGAGGRTCFKKNEFWATCQETCDPAGNWSCEALGERAKYDAACSWAGTDCHISKLCCNRGFVCAVKDKDFTGCVLTESTSTWVKKKVPIPADWEGTVVGGGRDEYMVQQAGPDDKKIGATLYCFMVFLPDSYEEALVAKAKDNQASIYGCDKHDLYHAWQSGSGGWDTGESTLMNTDVFYKVWEQVAERGDYENYDWTVKVDPDCVFAADRLRNHIYAWNLADWAAVYVKNNGLDKGLGNNGFLGAIEIFSKKAMYIYMDNAAGCLEALGTHAGEDGFMKGCMDGLGVGFVEDTNIFFPDRAAGACNNGERVAFHPLKDPDEWQTCWDIILGKQQWA